MQITKFGHSCLLVEDADARILIDPGNFSDGFQGVTGLTAVLVTHQHPDHLDMAALPALLAANPDARLITDPETAGKLVAGGVEAVAASAGDAFDVGTPVTVHGRDHAVIHRELPVIPNASFLIGGRLYHPGDALHVPDVPVEVLALPAAAPWMAVKEAIDFHRAVGAAHAFPIHDAVIAPVAVGAYFGRFETMGPSGATWQVPVSGTPFEL
ncbi:MBL fold metallo-hydrolase [Nakamurella sp. YIM 132087]|uniref:MBL fold metallo-hydrolase n=1 Tax=Nakamurella alba TaxID=2665158 RepID=A0A7K1FTE8_9ACTN|nr:MBL fold metallo-hydrolase [Nakamurella alba]MTD16074.1 MBL fold metallo-hydrolase [Nakamurella alba]